MPPLNDNELQEELFSEDNLSDVSNNYLRAFDRPSPAWKLGLVAAVIALFSFSFFASSVYIVNDLSDLKADRAHPKKRKRPLASGAISIPHAAMLWVGLLSASAFLATLLPI